MHFLYAFSVNNSLLTLNLVIKIQQINYFNVKSMCAFLRIAYNFLICLTITNILFTNNHLYKDCLSFMHVRRKWASSITIIYVIYLHIQISHMWIIFYCFSFHISSYVNLISPSNGLMFFTKLSKLMMNQDIGFDSLAVFGIITRINCLNRENGAHRSPKWQILWFGIFHKYLKICDESTDEIWPLGVLTF